MEQWFAILIASFLFFVMIVLHSIYQVTLERKLFLIRLHSPWLFIAESVIYGILGGAAASILIFLLGVNLNVRDLLGTWVISLILMLFNVRYVHFLYASGILSLFAYFTQTGLIRWDLIGLPYLQEYLWETEISSLLALAGILHLAEALLLYVQRNQSLVPIIYHGKRGRLVGGMSLQRLWFIPLLILIPSTKGVDLSFLPGWWPLFDGGMNDRRYSFAFIPVMMAYTNIIVRTLPKFSLRAAGRWLALFGIIIIALSYLTTLWPWMIVVCSLFTLFAYEAFLLYRFHREKNGRSAFSHANSGLSVLAVLPGSPADEMGILSGEIIAKVNGQPVHSTKEFYTALQQNAAFCKLEVINLEGNVKFVQRSLYSGEHHLLGIIFSPDEETANYLKSTYTNLFHLMMRRVKIGRKFY